LPMCGCGLESSAATTRATSSAATGEVLPSPNAHWDVCFYFG
jgi:hypothetical protein